MRALRGGDVVSRLVDLSNALPPSVGILAAIALIGLTVGLLCEALARCSTGLDPEHDPDMHEDPATPAQPDRVLEAAPWKETA